MGDFTEEGDGFELQLRLLRVHRLPLSEPEDKKAS
jgi:hypothetical protein